jgi:hypothetical protein
VMRKKNFGSSTPIIRIWTSLLLLLRYIVRLKERSTAYMQTTIC